MQSINSTLLGRWHTAAADKLTNNFFLNNTKIVLSYAISKTIRKQNNFWASKVV